MAAMEMELARSAELTTKPEPVEGLDVGYWMLDDGRKRVPGGKREFDELQIAKCKMQNEKCKMRLPRPDTPVGTRNDELPQRLPDP